MARFDKRDESSSAMLAEQRTAAIRHLREEMESRGLREADGWRISESTRESIGGTEIVLKPVHSRLEAPANLECVLHIGVDEGTVQMRCEPPTE